MPPPLVKFYHVCSCMQSFYFTTSDLDTVRTLCATTDLTSEDPCADHTLTFSLSSQFVFQLFVYGTDDGIDVTDVSI